MCYFNDLFGGEDNWWKFYEKNKKLVFCRFDVEDVYNEMWWKYYDEEFYYEKFFGKLLKDWFLFKNFKMEFYGKEVWEWILFIFIGLSC